MQCLGGGYPLPLAPGRADTWPNRRETAASSRSKRISCIRVERLCIPFDNVHTTASANEEETCGAAPAENTHRSFVWWIFSCFKLFSSFHFPCCPPPLPPPAPAPRRPSQSSSFVHTPNTPCKPKQGAGREEGSKKKGRQGKARDPRTGKRTKWGALQKTAVSCRSTFFHATPRLPAEFQRPTDPSPTRRCPPTNADWLHTHPPQRRTPSRVALHVQAHRLRQARRSDNSWLKPRRLRSRPRSRASRASFNPTPPPTKNERHFSPAAGLSGQQHHQQGTSLVRTGSTLPRRARTVAKPPQQYCYGDDKDDESKN